MNKNEKALKQLSGRLHSPLLWDKATRIAYSTDASAYAEMPLAVCLIKDERDLPVLIDFAKKHNTTLIPRSAGTSLAGQVVGSGIVIDVSRYWNKILEINEQERWVRLQPGVVLDELNAALKPYSLFFSPETSTSNRCCVGGMFGNNSCGSHSLIYGSTRQHVLEAKVILSNGCKATFSNKMTIDAKDKTDQSLQQVILRYIAELYTREDTRQLLERNFPSKDVTRRNNGYALDALINEDGTLNPIALLCGSEGTLAFTTELRLDLQPLPAKEKALLCVHFDKLQDALEANLIALQHNPVAIELIDRNIVEAAARNITQRRNMFFIEGKPEAILIIEFCKPTTEEIDAQIAETTAALKAANFGYAETIVRNEDIKRVWDLRKAGLGLLSNVVGSRKPVPVIEDTAVAPSVLPQYIAEHKALLDEMGLSCVYYAHISVGELHLRPVLDLSSEEDVVKFRQVADMTARLVKKYRGSLSGEHGDGRLRGCFIPLMYGNAVYELMKAMKNLWDPHNVFNKGKIIDTPSMNTHLRSQFLSPKPDIIHPVPQFKKTYFDFDFAEGLFNKISQCNGSADCRKSTMFGGTMCPSFRSSHSELDTPRARANMLRVLLSDNKDKNPFASKEIKQVLDECLLCKGCKSECPSNTDVALLKMEFLQHYYKHYGYPLPVLLMNALTTFQRIGTLCPSIYNWFMQNKATSYIIKAIMHFHQERTLPLLHKKSFMSQYKAFISAHTAPKADNKPVIYLFVDEFTRFQDANIAFDAVKLFSALGYRVNIAPMSQSGRIALSKGMVKRAKRIAKRNIKALEHLFAQADSKNIVVVGLEPSTVLSFRDEYPLLCRNGRKLPQSQILLYDEFISNEIDKGNINSEQFSNQSMEIMLHCHCQQKSLIGSQFTEKCLGLLSGANLQTIDAGCCGMAGSFGYDKRNFERSKAIAHSVLIPTLCSALEAHSDATKPAYVAAVGTSCREQINHWLPQSNIYGVKAPILHPISLLSMHIRMS
ncbi:MAG: FAD-binding oxidoreductase [Bacteroidales bacterium]|jgi:FAD/FMN-containing dehydrogenase/Fe-S oxidoreductase|nr:FAD-binding oxidoreductase [Bacteroidales bacterium]